jgi:hypothetical protein
MMVADGVIEAPGIPVLMSILWSDTQNDWSYSG